MESKFFQNLDEIDNIFIFYLVEKVPLKKIVLLKESCKFFNNITKQCKKQKAARDYCSLLKDTISTKKDIKIFNILIGQIKLFDLISSDIYNIHKMIQTMLDSNTIDFSCYICHNSCYNMKKYSLYESNKSKKYLICKKCVIVKKICCS